MMKNGLTKIASLMAAIIATYLFISPFITNVWDKPPTETQVYSIGIVFTSSIIASYWLLYQVWHSPVTTEKSEHE